MIGNILPVYKQPLLPREGWVAIKKLAYQDRFEQHVYTIYSATNEHQYFKGYQLEWKLQRFAATFTALPGTSFKAYEFDNDLSKMYLMHVQWKGQTIGRPQVDD